VKLMCSVQLDDTGSSKGLWVQHPTGKSPRLQSVAPTESPYQRSGCYSPYVTDTLLTFSPSEVSQPCRWAFTLPSCASEPRTIPPEEGLAHTSRRFKVSIRQSPGRTPKSSPNPLEAAHLPIQCTVRTATHPASWTEACSGVNYVNAAFSKTAQHQAKTQTRNVNKIVHICLNVFYARAEYTRGLACHQLNQPARLPK
jgi:hypothetical protein